MNNVKKISFNGYQNIGQATFTENLSKPSLTTTGFRFVAELTDEFTPELSQWKPILEKFPSIDGSNFVKIDYTQNLGFRNKLPYIALNGKRITIIEDNMPVFSKIAKLLTSIRETALKHKPEHPYPFKTTGDYSKTQNLLHYKPETEDEAINVDEIRDISWLINDEISMEMNEFLTRGKLKPITSIHEIVPGRGQL